MPASPRSGRSIGDFERVFLNAIGAPRGKRRAQADVLWGAVSFFGLLFGAFLLSMPQAWAVGFQSFSIADPGHGPLAVAIWYPSDDPATTKPLPKSDQFVAQDGAATGHGLPLVVISHGALASLNKQGALAEQIDTALTLARAGFVVAALVHNEFAPGPVIQVKDRSRQLHRLVDFMLTEWQDHARLDPARIGAFGYSLGGFTVLVAIGGEPDLAQIAPHCATAPAEWSCTHENLGIYHDSPAEPWLHDPRIKAAVIAAPALGYLFGPAGLARVHVPVQLWRGEEDHVLTEPWNAEAVERALPTPPEMHVVKGAGHADFLAPCLAKEARVTPRLCAEASGFDRAGFRVGFGHAILGYFQKALAAQ